MPRKQAKYGQPGIYNATPPTYADMEPAALAVDVNGRQILGTSTASIGTVTMAAGAAGAAGYPNGAVPVTATSGNVANTNAVATIPGVSAKTTYLLGFEITAAGATVGAVVTATITGLISGSASFTYTAPAGVLLAGPTIDEQYNPGIPSSAVNTAIVVTLPALGTGNTNATVNAHGYYL